MNLLEHYIKEVHSVKTIPHQDWMEEEWIEVEMTVNCYGNISKTTYYNTRENYERDLERGHYMG